MGATLISKSQFKAFLPARKIFSLFCRFCLHVVKTGFRPCPVTETQHQPTKTMKTYTIDGITFESNSGEGSPFLHEIPDAALERGGEIQELLASHGYDESPSLVIGRMNAWDLTVAQFEQLLSK